MIFGFVTQSGLYKTYGLVMLKRFGVKFLVTVLLLNLLLALAMQNFAKWGLYPDAVGHEIASSETSNQDAHWIAGNTLCNPRIAICH